MERSERYSGYRKRPNIFDFANYLTDTDIHFTVSILPLTYGMSVLKHQKIVLVIRISYLRGKK